MRKFLIGLGAFVVLLVVVAFLGPSFIPADSVKRDIAREVEAATGRTLSIDGSLNFTILPAPGVAATGLRLSNPEGASRPDMVRLESATVEVALLPLLSGRIQVARIVLDRPDVVLETYSDGGNNWTFAPPTGASGAAGDPDDGASASGGDGLPAIRLDDVVIRNGTLAYHTPEGEQRVERFDATLGAGSLAGPFRARGSLTADGLPVRFEAAVGALSEDRASPANLTVALSGTELTYAGVLSGYPDRLRLAGQVRAQGGDAGALLTALGGGAPPGVLAGKPLAMETKLTATASAVAFNDINLRLAGITATGAVDVGFADTPTINGVLNIGHVDLDALLNTAGPAPQAGTGGMPSGPQRTGAPAGDGAAAPDAGSGFALPRGIDVSVETKVETIEYSGGVIRQALLNAQLADGALTVSQASAQLPGGASVSLVGYASPRAGEPAFEGQAEASADDLRALLTWLGVDVDEVPPERLRKMVGSARIDATPDNVTITDIDLSVDVSRLRGGVAIAPRARPGFGIGLSLDKINLDAYLPKAGQAPPAAGVPAATPGGSAAADTPPQESGGGKSGLAVLHSFDAIVQLKAGEITWQGQQIRGMNLDGTLQNGNLDLRDFAIQSLAGARARASGKLNDLAGAPTADLSLDIDASDFDRLVRLAGGEPPFPVGKGRLTGSVKGDLENAELDLTLAALDATLSADGTVAPLAAPPRFDVVLALAHPDASALAAAVRGEPAGAMPTTGALEARVSAKGGLAGADIDAAVSLGEGEMTAKGRLENLVAGAPTGNLRVDAGYPDFVGLIRLFAPDYRPALAEAGAFRLAGDVTLAPDMITLANLDGTAGPVGYKGDATVRTGGPRPAITAELATSEIVADWFLPASSRGTVISDQAGGQAGGVAAAGGGRWSRAPLELAALREADADISLTAPAITYTDVRVEEPKLEAGLKDGVLDLRRLSGRAYGGSFDMTGELAARDEPTLRYTMKMDGADAAQFMAARAAAGGGGMGSVLDLLFPVSSLRLVQGTLGADIDVSTAGGSEYAMISNLDGSGATRFADAVVEGVDVCRISNRFGNLNGLEGFLGLALAAQGGLTRIGDFQGRFELADGVATLPEQTIAGECADVTFSGTTNLPRWTIDVTARAVFPEHPKFPGVVVEQKGPMDAPNTRLVNVNEINQYVAGKAAGLLRKVLPEQQGGQQGGAPDGEATGGAPAPAKPEDEFKNLLDSLIKRR